LQFGELTSTVATWHAH